MSGKSLSGCRLMIVEDEFLVPLHRGFDGLR